MDKILKIFVVEDNLSDRKLLETTIQRNPLSAELHFSESIEDFENLLRNTLIQELPDLILLDLNISGEETLSLISEIKRRKEMQHIPVIVMSSSDDPSTIQRCYENMASGFMMKEMDFHRHVETIDLFLKYWYFCMKLPKHRKRD